MSSTPRADFWFSIFLIAFGLAAGVESWRMPRLENLGVDPMSAPGLTPGLLALVITTLGLVLLLRRTASPAGATGDVEAGWGRLTLALILCIAYALGLLGRVDFLAATALFVFAFALVFSEPGMTWVRRVLVSALLAAGTSVAVTFLFERVFLIRLP